MIRLKAPDGMTSCSVDGKTYEVDKSGHVEVPSAVVPTLASHGLTVAPAPPEVEVEAEVEETVEEAPAVTTKQSTKPQLKK